MSKTTAVLALIIGGLTIAVAGLFFCAYSLTMRVELLETRQSVTKNYVQYLRSKVSDLSFTMSRGVGITPGFNRNPGDGDWEFNPNSDPEPMYDE